MIQLGCDKEKYVRMAIFNPTLEYGDDVSGSLDGDGDGVGYGDSDGDDDKCLSQGPAGIPPSSSLVKYHDWGLLKHEL